MSVAWASIRLPGLAFRCEGRRLPGRSASLPGQSELQMLITDCHSTCKHAASGKPGPSVVHMCSTARKVQRYMAATEKQLKLAGAGGAAL